MKKELQIILGFNCNFSCGHCLNNSRPGYKGFDIKADEVVKLKADIESNIDVSVISFSGGEPLLYLKEISDIVNYARNLKNRNFQFSITTNGSLIGKLATDLEALAIEFCTISYDYAHNKFITEEKITTHLQTAKRLFQKLEINFIYNDISEIQLIKNIATSVGVKVNFNRQIYSGRSQVDTNLKTGHSSFKCPNISDTDLIKITYVPSKGYSICCGPVIFDKLASDASTYANQINLVERTDLFKLLEQSEASGIVSAGEVICNTCRHLVSNTKLSNFLKRIQ